MSHPIESLLPVTRVIQMVSPDKQYHRSNAVDMILYPLAEIRESFEEFIRAGNIHFEDGFNSIKFKPKPLRTDTVVEEVPLKELLSWYRLTASRPAKTSAIHRFFFEETRVVEKCPIRPNALHDR